jgi:nitrate reductase NapE
MIDPSQSVIGRRRKEFIVFLILAVLLAPVIAVGLVGSYGFSIWMYQAIAGPPSSSEPHFQSQ